jgi:hypothetical protein
MLSPSNSLYSGLSTVLPVDFAYTASSTKNLRLATTSCCREFPTSIDLTTNDIYYLFMMVLFKQTLFVF